MKTGEEKRKIKREDIIKIHNKSYIERVNTKIGLRHQ